jgi:uncharacterized protein involved in exopolysaccharide biosynthesis
MELREYVRVIVRYWWLIAALVIVVAVGSWFFAATRAPIFGWSALYHRRQCPPASDIQGYDPS